MTYPTKFTVQRRPRRMMSLGCLALFASALVICGIGALLLISIVPRLGLQAAGFAVVGDTETVFDAAPPVIPTVQMQNPVIPAQVVIETRDYGSFNLDSRQSQLQMGEALSGGQVATVIFNEAQLLALCQQRTRACGTGDSRIRNATIDLRAGGAVIYADVMVPTLNVWQRAGIVLRINPSTAQITVAGVDYNGVLYQAPPGELQALVAQVEQTANAVLRDAVVNANGASLRLSEIHADDQQLTLVLR